MFKLIILLLFAEQIVTHVPHLGYYSTIAPVQQFAPTFYQVAVQQPYRVQPSYVTHHVQQSYVPSYNQWTNQQLGYSPFWPAPVSPQPHRRTMLRLRNQPQNLPQTPGIPPRRRIGGESTDDTTGPVPRVRSGQTGPTNARLRELQLSERMCEKFYEARVYIQVVGGEPAKPGEFEFMAALGWDGSSGYEYRCGGTLVSDQYVLTAAHCTSNNRRTPRVVKLGGGNLRNQSGEVVNIERITVHPKYRSTSDYDDIALLKLAKKVTSVRPACLWTESKISANQARAIGYGSTDFAGPVSEDLLKVNLTIFSNAVCSRFYRPNARIRNGIVNSQLCVGDAQHERDTCQGDSGGPVLIDNYQGSTRVPYAIGITSVGLQCAGVAPSVYTRVSSYIDWIESVVWPRGS